MTDKIKVITQTTQERYEEIVQLYEDCRPYLLQGLTLRQAVSKVKGMKNPPSPNLAWFRDLRQYAWEHGYKGW